MTGFGGGGTIVLAVVGAGLAGGVAFPTTDGGTANLSLILSNITFLKIY